MKTLIIEGSVTDLEGDMDTPISVTMSEAERTRDVFAAAFKCAVDPPEHVDGYIRWKLHVEDERVAAVGDMIGMYSILDVRVMV